MNSQLEGADFKGFLIRGFKSDGSPTGSFTPTDEADILACSGKSSVTHKDSKIKQKVTLKWSPGCESCSVYFNYTVVQNFSNYWVKIQSELINV